MRTETEIRDKLAEAKAKKDGKDHWYLFERELEWAIGPPPKTEAHIRGRLAKCKVAMGRRLRGEPSVPASKLREVVAIWRTHLSAQAARVIEDLIAEAESVPVPQEER